MHHSSLATITEKGIVFSSDLLTPLSIREDSPVWAAYYPTPEKYNLPKKYHDLMITAVPYECWLFAGRFRIWLKHQSPGGLQKLTNIFRDNGMSIISSEASRSGHRYATCTTTVCVDSVMCDYNEYQTLTPQLIKEIKYKVSKKIENCVVDIKSKCQDFHFSDPNALGLEKPVMGERLDSLGYFFEKTVISKAQNDKAPYFKPWRFRFIDGVLRPDKDTRRFMSVTMGDSVPSRAFAEINTREMQLRLAIIPKNEIRSFGWIVTKYQWNDPNLNSTQVSARGICELDSVNRNIIPEITKIISKKKHNIWRYFTHITLRDRDGEEGTIEFFVKSFDNSEDFMEQRKKLEDSLNSSTLDIEGASITSVKVTPIFFKRIFLSIRANCSKKDELQNICKEVGEQYGMLPDDFRVVETNIYSVTDTVANEIKNSDAMIQYYGNIEKDPEKYDWLNAELFAAKVLDLPVVTIVEAKEGESIREKIKTLGDKAPIKISIEPHKAELKKAIETALAQLSSFRKLKR